MADRDISDAVKIASRNNEFHPVKDFLSNPTWDDRPRVETLFIDYFGTPDTPYHRETARLFCIAAVTRIFEPGHKFDFAPIVEGLQGKRKTTFIETLAMNRWAISLSGDMGDRKKMIEQMQGSWIIELPELAGMYKSEIPDTKAFISATEDTVRMDYAHHPSVFKRSQVFFGSTNDHKYLKDPTGNRRFWPIKCLVNEIDIGRLEQEISQVWAEAVVMYHAMRGERPEGRLPLFLSQLASEEAIAAQEYARITTNADELASVVSDWLDTPVNASGRPMIDDVYDEIDGVQQRYQRVAICGLQIWREYMQNDIAKYDKRAQQTVAEILQTLPGWKYWTKKRVPGYGHPAVYVREGVKMNTGSDNWMVQPIPNEGNV